jgi:carbonic anhydrase
MLKKILITSVVATIGTSSGVFAEGVHWSYKDAQHWGKVSKDFAACGVGKEQSPIDIKGAVKADLKPIQFDYKPSVLNIVDNGHTIQVNYDKGSSITVGGSTYELLQFHFHRPSEEKVNGRSYDMVAHLVHKNAEGKLAVVAVLFDNGTENPVLKTLWSNIPKEKEKVNSVKGTTINVADLLPADKNYYNFPGSLTTPPCSEGVNWLVLKTPVKASAQQFAAFGKLYANNARPVQPLNGRVIRASN